MIIIIILYVLSKIFLFLFSIVVINNKDVDEKLFKLIDKIFSAIIMKYIFKYLSFYIQTYLCYCQIRPSIGQINVQQNTDEEKKLKYKIELY
jgi:hypothetical protein